MLPNCFSVHSNMAPAAQPLLRRSGTRQGMGRHWPSLCDGCMAVYHALSLSGSIIKILDLQQRERKRRGGGRGGINNQKETRPPLKGILTVSSHSLNTFRIVTDTHSERYIYREREVHT